ncbi:MAG: Ig-like domain-containing protein, partial [Gemmatimonadetes bacterium]|nr:Ig-like domain-containing protein [Gemmatimonadota bacterium]
MSASLIVHLRTNRWALVMALALAACSDGSDAPTDPGPPAGDAPVAGVAVSPQATEVEEGSAYDFDAVATDSSGAVLDDRPFTWATSDQDVAVIDSTGFAKTLSPGVATISAASEGISGSATLTVVPTPVAGVAVFPVDTLLEAGQSVQLTAEARDRDGSLLTGRAMAWSSSDPAIAAVSGDGLV